jgi:hypothetical protein
MLIKDNAILLYSKLIRNTPLRTVRSLLAAMMSQLGIPAAGSVVFVSALVAARRTPTVRRAVS